MGGATPQNDQNAFSANWASPARLVRTTRLTCAGGLVIRFAGALVFTDVTIGLRSALEALR